MIIKEITLYSNDLSSQRNFYIDTCGFELLNETEDYFSVRCGKSILSFAKATKIYKYHYCFLIAENHLHEALDWCISNGLDPIIVDDGPIVNQSDSWNAKSIYFYDGNGNIAEFIVRYDLSIIGDRPFDPSQIILFNEIGAPSKDIGNIYSSLKNIGVEKWLGNEERFLSAGTQNGLFLLVNNQVKRTWFPTEVSTDPSPWKGVFEVNKKDHHIQFCGKDLNIF